jgi:hypothetical protein
MILNSIRNSFRPLLSALTSNVEKYLGMVRRSKRSGIDYQADFCIPLSEELGCTPLEVCQKIIDKLDKP